MLTIRPELDFNADSHLQAVQDSDISLPYEERDSDSTFIERIWHSYSESGGSFTSAAESHSEIVVSRYERSTILTVRGPETRATAAYGPPHTEYVGIVFKIGTFMPKFPASMVMDRHDVNLPQAGSQSFWLDGSAWEFPTFENADTFINRLVRAGLLVHDPIVDETLREQPTTLSRRTVQRRFLQATGLTHSNVFQIQRARYATNLLKEGLSILDAVDQAGYTDQPHLTRALRQLMGRTPGQITSRNIGKPMSLLFKTPPF